MKKFLDTGEATPIFELGSAAEITGSPRISPDGKTVLFVWKMKDNDPFTWAAVLSLNGGNVRRLTMPVSIGEVGQFRWSPDGKFILYVRTVNGVGNIWSVGLDGKAPTRVTHFDSERIFDFDVSLDNRLVISRGAYLRDVVLLNLVR